MSTLKLYGHPFSPATMVKKLSECGTDCQKAKLALYEKGVPFEEQKIDLGAGEQKQVEYKKLQPFGVVPVIEDDGYLLYGTKLVMGLTF
jgi:glutathione S-transferase